MVKPSAAQVKLLRYLRTAEASGLSADVILRREERTYIACVRRGWVRRVGYSSLGNIRAALTDAGRAALEEGHGNV